MLYITIVIVLFGAIQGFALCLYFFIKKKENKKAFGYYFLFLFSLSFFNLLYALLYLNIDTVFGIPRASFPFPYKYLIGVGFYFYIKNQISKEEGIISKGEYFLFLPAFFYGLLRFYWYLNIHLGLDKDIFLNVYNTGFFTYNEFVYLIFNFLLMWFVFRFLRTYKTKIRGSNIVRKNWEWLLKFSYVFVGFISLNILHQIIVNLTDLEQSGELYLIILILNSIYIYWVGFESLTKSKFLFNTFVLKNQNSTNEKFSIPFIKKLEHYIKIEEIFTNKNLKVSELSLLVGITEKELSLYIHEHFRMSFSDYINKLRIEKVKILLNTEDQKKYTLLAIAENAGFSSKSSFNSVFKKMTGLTPTQYKTRLKN